MATCAQLPSQTCACEMFDDPSAKTVGVFLAATLGRSLLIMPALYLAGIRDRRAVYGGLAAAAFISSFVVLYTAFARSK